MRGQSVQDLPCQTLGPQDGTYHHQTCLPLWMPIEDICQTCRAICHSTSPPRGMPGMHLNLVHPGSLSNVWGDTAFNLPPRAMPGMHLNLMHPGSLETSAGLGEHTSWSRSPLTSCRKSGIPLRSGMSKPRPWKKGITSLHGPWNSMWPAHDMIRASGAGGQGPKHKG